MCEDARTGVDPVLDRGPPGVTAGREPPMRERFEVVAGAGTMMPASGSAVIT
jgi:hypothetical protein